MTMSGMSSSGNDPKHEDILTLEEAAAYLRVSEEAVEGMARDGMLPAQRIGDEWRFIKKALVDWMRWGGGNDRRYHRWPYHPEFLFEGPFLEEMLHLLEERLIRKLKAESVPKPGSKEAVRKIIGIFKDDDDLEERLADGRKRRGSG